MTRSICGAVAVTGCAVICVVAGLAGVGYAIGLPNPLSFAALISATITLFTGVAVAVERAVPAPRRRQPRTVRVGQQEHT